VPNPCELFAQGWDSTDADYRSLFCQYLGDGKTRPFAQDAKGWGTPLDPESKRAGHPTKYILDKPRWDASMMGGP
jgi:hypothetical protein